MRKFMGNFMAVWKISWAAYRKNFFALAGIAIVFFLPAVFVSDNFVSILIALDVSLGKLSPLLLDPLKVSIPILIGLFFLLHLLAFFSALNELAQGRKIGIWKVYKNAVKGWPGFLAVMLQVLFKIALWALALVFPGIIFGILYSGAPLAYVIDQAKGRRALELSRSVIKPNFNRYLDSLLLALVLTVIMLAPVIFTLDWLIELAVLRRVYWAARAIDYTETGALICAAMFLKVFYFQLYLQMKTSYNTDVSC